MWYYGRLLVLIDCLLLAASDDSSFVKYKYQLNAREFFVLPLTAENFTWEAPILNSRFLNHKFRLTASDRFADVRINHYAGQHAPHKIFIYGFAAKPVNNLELQIKAVNLDTFNTGLETISLDFADDSQVYNYKLGLKILNLDLSDVLLYPNFRRTFLTPFHSRQYPGSNLKIVSIDSFPDIGGRVPIVNSTKRGVHVEFWSKDDIIHEDTDIGREIIPLQKLASCNYKRTSFDRLFRKNGFQIDWCSVTSTRIKEEVNVPPILKRHGLAFSRKDMRQKKWVFFLYISGIVCTLIYICFLMIISYQIFKGFKNKELLHFIGDNLKFVKWTEPPARSWMDYRHSSVERQCDAIKERAKSRQITPCPS